MESEYIRRTGQLIEYMKLHLISLEQDSQKLVSEMNLIEDMNSDEYWDLEIADISLNGQMIATAHLLSVAADILGVDLKEK
jgi:hypothetical protein